MTFRFALSLVFALLLWVVPGPARAEIIDVAAIRCQEYLTADAARASTFTTFLIGYYAAVKGMTVIDMEKVAGSVEKVKSLCASNPESSVMGLIEHEFGLVPPHRVYRPTIK